MPTGLSEGTMPLNDEGNHAMGNIVSESTPKVRSLTKPPRLGRRQAKSIQMKLVEGLGRQTSETHEKERGKLVRKCAHATGR